MQKTVDTVELMRLIADCPAVDPQTRGRAADIWMACDPRAQVEAFMARMCGDGGSTF